MRLAIYGALASRRRQQRSLSHYKLEKWTKGGQEVDHLLYGGNNLRLAQDANVLGGMISIALPSASSPKGRRKLDSVT
jgi:hypothetical protein